MSSISCFLFHVFYFMLSTSCCQLHVVYFPCFIWSHALLFNFFFLVFHVVFYFRCLFHVSYFMLSMSCLLFRFFYFSCFIRSHALRFNTWFCQLHVVDFPWFCILWFQVSWFVVHDLLDLFYFMRCCISCRVQLHMSMIHALHFVL